MLPVSTEILLCFLSDIPDVAPFQYLAKIKHSQFKKVKNMTFTFSFPPGHFQLHTNHQLFELCQQIGHWPKRKPSLPKTMVKTSAFQTLSVYHPRNWWIFWQQHSPPTLLISTRGKQVKFHLAIRLSLNYSHYFTVCHSYWTEVWRSFMPLVVPLITEDFHMLPATWGCWATCGSSALVLGLPGWLSLIL